MTTMTVYEVGGCVRDSILGLPSKDIDYTVVLGDYPRALYASPFEAMCACLEIHGFKIFVRNPEFFTARAQFPKADDDLWNELTGLGISPVKPGMVADFVLARREYDYDEKRRPRRVELGTLEDDLSRRDFTMNAIAKAPDGSLVDPFNGRDDIAFSLIKCVGDPNERFIEDPLRMLRAARFAVKYGFHFDKATLDAIRRHCWRVSSVSQERIREELDKMFRVDTRESLRLLFSLRLEYWLFKETDVWLMPTLKEK